VIHKFPSQWMNNLTGMLNLNNNVQEITDGRGVDVAVEALGKALTFAQCTKSVRDGGKAVMIGLAATNVVGEIDITRLVRRQVSYPVQSTY
jgi:threonine dehydrogenase-like Zn-dependent dehydrogenase